MSDALFTMLDGVRRQLTEEEAAAVRAQWAAAEAAVAPPPAPRWTPLQFIERFTEAEQIAIVTAAMASPALRLWYDKAMASQEIVADDARTVAGLAALVAAGLISETRKTEILGGT